MIFFFFFPFRRITDYAKFAGWFSDDLSRLWTNPFLRPLKGNFTNPYKKRRIWKDSRREDSIRRNWPLFLFLIDKLMSISMEMPSSWDALRKQVWIINFFRLFSVFGFCLSYYTHFSRFGCMFGPISDCRWPWTLPFEKWWLRAVFIVCYLRNQERLMVWLLGRDL